MRPDDLANVIEQPFPPDTPADLSIEHPAWREAQASLDFLIASGRRDFVISGDERAGKSQFIASAQRRYGEKVRLLEAQRDGSMPDARLPDGSTPTPIFIRRATPAEITGFLHDRLRAAAFAPETLSRSATDAIVGLADGSVGRANELASAAFDTARSRQARRIDRRDVGGRRLAAMAAAESRPPRSRRLPTVPFLVEGLVVLVAAVVVVLALPGRDTAFLQALVPGMSAPHRAPAPGAMPPASADAGALPPSGDRTAAASGDGSIPPSAPLPPPSDADAAGPPPAAPPASSSVPAPAPATADTSLPPPPDAAAPNAAPPVADGSDAGAAPPAPAPAPSATVPPPMTALAPLSNDAGNGLPPSNRAPLLVAVRFPPGALGAALVAERLATRLAAAGVAVDGPSPLRERLRPGITYAFAEDEAAASRLAASLGPDLAGAVPEAMPPEAAINARPGQIDIVVANQGPTP